MGNANLPDAKILIVEDNPVDSELLQQILFREGYQNISAVLDPREAADLHRQHHFDLIVLDFNMPHLDGLQVMAQLRSIEGESLLPVLMITAQNDRTLRLNVLREGARDFVSKPFDRTEVVTRINNALELLMLNKKVREQNKILERREANLRAAKTELEAHVAARTADLVEANRRLLAEVEMRRQAQAALADARDKALEASELKSAFLANVSHEIRTPLNGMLGMLSLLLDSGLQADQQDYARTAFVSGELLLSLINEILDFSKVESGKLELETVAYDFRQLVHDVVHLFDEQAAARNLEVAVLIAPEVPNAVLGDPARVRQVVSNLMGNAVKFTERGEVIIRASVAREGEQTVQLRLEVKDTGIGIPAQKQGRIFESFTQADGSTTRKFGGTGLGLAICKQLVELMGGEIGLHSEEGVGSTFWFTIPQGKAPVTQRGAAHSDDLPPVRVLIVGDHKGKFMAIKRYLGVLNVPYEVTLKVAEVPETLRAAARAAQSFDLVVMDVASLEADGLQLVSAVKQDPEIAAARIVLLAAGGLRGHARMARDAGVSAYITKPINQERLRDTLIAVMRAPEGDSTLVTRFDLADETSKWRGSVLVVEDNAVNQKVAVKMLARLQVRADVAPDGKAAVEAVQRSSYDLVFMDCLMPEMDGFQTTRVIRTAEQSAAAGRRVPIIAMTANVRPEDRQKCLECGMDDFLPKPVTLDTVRAVVDKWLPMPDAERAE